MDKSLIRPRGRPPQAVKRSRHSDGLSEPAAPPARESEIRTRRSAGASTQLGGLGHDNTVTPSPPRKKAAHDNSKVQNSSSASTPSESNGASANGEGGTGPLARQGSGVNTSSNVHRTRSNKQDSAAIPPADQQIRSAFFRKEVKRRRYFKGMTYSLGTRKKKPKPKAAKTNSPTGKSVASASNATSVEGQESESTQESFAEDSAAEGHADTSAVMETSCDDSKDVIEEDEEEEECPQESDVEQDNADQENDDGQEIDNDDADTGHDDEGDAHDDQSRDQAEADQDEQDDDEDDDQDEEVEITEPRKRRSLRERVPVTTDNDADDDEVDEDESEEEEDEDEEESQDEASKDAVVMKSEEGVVDEPDDEKLQQKIHITIKMANQDTKEGGTPKVVETRRRLEENGAAAGVGSVSTPRANGSAVNGRESRDSGGGGNVGNNSILSSVKTRNRVKRRYDENLVDIDDPTFVEAAGDVQGGDTGQQTTTTVAGGTSAAATAVAISDGPEEPARPSRGQQPSPPVQGAALVPYYTQEASIVPSNYKIEHLIDKSIPMYRCHCLSLPLSHAPPPAAGNDFLCQALDGIAGRILGCSKKVKSFDLYRASQRTAFGLLCEGHLVRLLGHQCCPTCGVFCTQGEFMMCRTGEGTRIQRHFYHRECAFRPSPLETVGGVTDLCPHCGETNKMMSIKLTLESESSAVSFSQKISSTGPRAKMSLGSSARDMNDGIERPAITLAGMPTPEEPLGDEVDIMVNDKSLLTANTAWCPDINRVTRAAQAFNKALAPRVNTKTLFSAARQGDVERVVLAIMSGVDLCSTSAEEDNYTALHVAAEMGHVDVCHLLVRAGCPLDALDAGLYTPFMTAVAAGKGRAARCLMALGADTAKCGEDGMTCLHLASKAGLHDVVQLILKRSTAQVNAQDEGGWTPIVWASEHQHSNVVLLLLKHGANPNIRDSEGNTALHWSAYSGTVDILLMYLELGSDINGANELGDTPLHVAARQDKYEMVMLLLGREADVCAINEAGQTPIEVVKDKNSPCFYAIQLSVEMKKAIRSARRAKPVPRVVHKDISRGKEKHAIRVVNEVDEDRSIPSDFMYLTNNCETTLLHIDTTIQSLQSCKCQDDCTSILCQCTQLANGCWYRDGRLVEHFNFKEPPILFECNRACACFTTCQNRVLQNGIKVHLELFKTALTGWGVRALQEIPKGSFVCEYVGEVITDKEADQREEDSYLFDLENRDGDTFCIDARHYGNVSRFINHACEPNVHPVRVYVDHHDLRFPRIALFATRDIAAGEQLGFDYGEKFWVIKYKSFLCGCGSPRCKYNADNIQTALEAYYNRNATDDDSIVSGE
ncbi:histone-lysine N-methyltransferase EHMT2-like isoform X2 [Varroa jacobsoni]|uniref:Histone-lysine N-methyltransferase EHMT2 n=1 Tax=Varroa destructor TaxID=109461 RepID=A0A7M7JLG9_VARDE|nr:histone-lysine N-methyltransferase EHMT2-like isoform X3 [Varroa destructor]XP_022704779.1 histone-lysine N-methyltransferase EHMT2-like isoform X2 [Varroa jacobsoni]